jgi:hypothetical protein
MKLTPATKAFEVEQGLPMPRRWQNRGKYPWADMQVGDAFFVPRTMKHIYGLASSVGKARGKRYAVREYVHPEKGECLGVWREE